MAKKSINCMSVRPTPPYTNAMESGPGNSFPAQNRKKTKRFMIFDQKKGGGSFFDATPAPHPTLPLQTSKKVGFKWGGGGAGGPGPKTHWGVCLLDKIMILQRVELTIQVLG